MSERETENTKKERERFGTFMIRKLRWCLIHTAVSCKYWIPTGVVQVCERDGVIGRTGIFRKGR